jgi:hypothetical protein
MRWLNRGDRVGGGLRERSGSGYSDRLQFHRTVRPDSETTTSNWLNRSIIMKDVSRRLNHDGRRLRAARQHMRRFR